MKLLRSFECPEEAEKTALEMRMKGVAAFVEIPTGRGAIYPGGPDKLYVFLDRQFEDASKLLEDANHRVSEPLSEAEIEDILYRIEHPSGESLLNIAGLWATILLSLLVIGWLASRVFLFATG